MGYFMNMPLCRSVAMPHAKKLICRKNDRFPPCSSEDERHDVQIHRQNVLQSQNDGFADRNFVVDSRDELWGFFFAHDVFLSDGWEG